MITMSTGDKAAGQDCAVMTAQGGATVSLPGATGGAGVPTGVDKFLYDPLTAPYPPTGTGTTTISLSASDPFYEWQKRRDELAKAAMVKLLEKKSLTFDEVAQMAYLMADKMLEQSVKPSVKEKDDKGLVSCEQEEEPAIPMDITIDGKGPDEPQKDSCADSDFQAVLKALVVLVSRIGIVHNSDEYKQVFAVHQHMCGIYNGPTYTEELEKALSVLSKILSKGHKKP